jgi:hypothetical protein
LKAIKIKKGNEKTPGTPLRPHILAAFLPWGGFAGAGRPTRSKGKRFGKYQKRFFYFLSMA